MRHRLLRALLALMSAALLLSGCALPSFPGQTHGPQRLPDAQQIMREVETGNLFELPDPALVFSMGEPWVQLIFPPLVTLDNQNQVAPWAADKWETSSDGLTWTFHLHPGMKWSDDVPIDANTFAYSINRALDPCTPSAFYWIYFETQDPTATSDLIKGSGEFTGAQCPDGAAVSPRSLIGSGLIVPDPLTLQVILTHPAAYLPAFLTASLAWAVPRHLVELYGTESPPDAPGTHTPGWTHHLTDHGGFGGNLYKLTAWDYPSHLILARNETFWGQKPKLRMIDWTLYHTPHDAFTAFGAGKSDYLHGVSADDLAHAAKSSELHTEPEASISTIELNWHLAPFDDLRVRQAFSLALDRAALAQSPGVIPSIHLIPQGIPGYNPDLRDSAGRTGGAALHPDLEKAQALWKAYLDDKFGGDASKAPVVNLYSGGAHRPLDPLGLHVIDQLGKALPGLRIVWGEYDHTQHHEPQPIQSERRSIAPDYPDLESIFGDGSPLYPLENVDIPEANSLLSRALSDPDSHERLGLYQQVEQLYVTQVAHIPLVQYLNQYLLSARVAGGYHENSFGFAALSIWQRIYMAAR